MYCPKVIMPVRAMSTPPPRSPMKKLVSISSGLKTVAAQIFGSMR